MSVDFEEYQKIVREKATESHFDLRSTLDSDPGVSPARRRVRSRSHSPGYSIPQENVRQMRSPGNTSSWEPMRPVEHSDYTYGESVKRLHKMLNKVDYQSRQESQRNVQFTPRATSGYMGNVSMYGTYPTDDGAYLQYPRGELPSLEDAAQILQHQSSYAQNLYIENKYVKDEMQLLKIKLQEVIEENRLLHEEIKRGAISEIIGEGIEFDGDGEVVKEKLTLSTTRQGEKVTQENMNKWQRELERIQGLHTAKTERLETQLKIAREENQKYDATVNELQAKVRILETIQGSSDTDLIGLAAGLCVRCGQNEAILPPSVAESQKRSLETLTRERDNLLTEVGSLKMKYSSLMQREQDAYEQVKRAVEMVEQAQLEQTQALIQKEQLKEELTNMRNRMQDHVEEITHKLTDERELVRKEYQHERDELNQKVKELTEAFVNCQSELEKSARDKISLMAELEMAKSKLDSFDIDYGQATDSMKMTTVHATLECKKAVQQLGKVKQESERQMVELEQEKNLLRTELHSVRGRLGKAEQELVETKEQCITLTNNMQQLEREAHLAKLAKDMIEKNRAENTRAMTKRAEQRESELNTLIDTLEARHSQTTSELEELLHQHESLVQKLQTECKRLAGQLENVTSKYKHANRGLKSQNDQLKMRLERSYKRLNELENQHTQGGILQEKMRQRLKQMDDHALHSSTQLLELLARESSLMKDRAVLAREVEFLRCSLKSQDTCHLEKLLSTQQGMVDEILRNVKTEETQKIKQDVAFKVEKLRSEEIDDLAKDEGNEKYDGYSSSFDSEDV